MAELYDQLKKRFIRKEIIENFTEINYPIYINATRVLTNVCYKALAEIRAVLDDCSLDDRACFEKIEKIVSIYEALGSDGGARHDFG